MHHGYYGPDGNTPKDRRQAQIDLIEELLRWGGIATAGRILDAGCGVGGSARYLARRFQASVLGLNISPVQLSAAAVFTQSAGLQEQVRFQLRDLLTVAPQDGPFDLIWSVESTEHLADKAELLTRFYQVLSPGGRLLLTTWCHRPPVPPLSSSENRLLQKVCRAFHIPAVSSLAELEAMAAAAGFKNVSSADWSKSIAPFGNAVLWSIFKIRDPRLLLRTGWSTVQGALAIRGLGRACRMGLIHYHVLQAEHAG